MAKPAPPATPLELLNGLTPGQFLDQYWQKKPLLVRQALPGFAPPLAADELAGLACEEFIESRIITGNAADNDWQLQHGPFDEQHFNGLGERDWTLLVQAVDHYLPAVAALKDLFRFIPDWRLDDVMASFAAPGGSVGPHLDQYDVFLIQGEGTRQWQWGEPCNGDAPLLEHADLQLLSEFRAVETCTLAAGDMLYLPPGYPHWGIALEPCMTYSVGFRAPSHQEILSDFCDHQVARLDAGLRYSDADLLPADNPGKIDAQAIARVRSVLASMLDEEAMAHWLGCYMTAPKYEDDAPVEVEASGDLRLHAHLELNPASRIAYSEQEQTTVLYADGESYSGTGKAWRHAVHALCLQRTINLDEGPGRSGFDSNTLQQLLLRGVLLEA